MRVLLVLLSILINGCAATNGLSIYSLSNADLEAVITEELPNLQQNITMLGVPIEFGMDELDVNIGPDQREVISLGMSGEARISAFVISYPIKLNFKVEGSPYYDSDKKAVFVQDVRLIDASIDAGAYKGNLRPLNAQVMQILNDFLAKNPVYKLDTSNPTQRLLSTIPLNLEIQEGRLSLVPAY